MIKAHGVKLFLRSGDVRHRPLGICGNVETMWEIILRSLNKVLSSCRNAFLFVRYPIIQNTFRTEKPHPY